MALSLATIEYHTVGRPASPLQRSYSRPKLSAVALRNKTPPQRHGQRHKALACLCVGVFCYLGRFLSVSVDLVLEAWPGLGKEMERCVTVC